MPFFFFLLIVGLISVALPYIIGIAIVAVLFFTVGIHWLNKYAASKIKDEDD